MELNDRSVRHTFDAPRVQCLGFSPDGSYLWLWSSPEKFHRDSLNENFQIYKISKCDGKLKMDLVHSIQLSNYNNSELYWIDEKSCFQIVSKTIKFFIDGQLGINNLYSDYQKEIPGLVSASFSTKFACTFVEPADTVFFIYIRIILVLLSCFNFLIFRLPHWQVILCEIKRISHISGITEVLNFMIRKQSGCHLFGQDRWFFILLWQ